MWHLQLITSTAARKCTYISPSQEYWSRCLADLPWEPVQWLQALAGANLSTGILIQISRVGHGRDMEVAPKSFKTVLCISDDFMTVAIFARTGFIAKKKSIVSYNRFTTGKTEPIMVCWHNSEILLCMLFTNAKVGALPLCGIVVQIHVGWYVWDPAK